MIKILICLFGGVAVGLFVLNLRHQQLELNHQNAELHDQIKSHQAKLWSQQLQIAELTAPNAINETVKGEQIEMVPVFASPRGNWIQPDPPSRKKTSSEH
ncbi:MAG TPA: hypothetical protein VFC78_13815 [Tepidisphaeraceae bacterium]|nr:hypothetical protein [Tepidisphaeraceae bacterium]